jgi:hypothetical protein
MKKLVVPMMAGVMMFGGFAGSASAATFKDVVKGSYYEDSVHFLYDYGVTSGVSADKFGVGHKLTRETAVTLLMKTLGYTEEDANAAEDVNFKDVDKNSYYYKFIKLAYELDIVNGVGNGKFDPKKTMTRAEMAVIIDKAYELDFYGEEAKSPFVDLKEASWATDYINRVYREGITSGTSATTFGPNSQITREDFATFLYKAFMNDVKSMPKLEYMASGESISLALGVDIGLDKKKLNFILMKDGKPVEVKQEVTVPETDGFIIPVEVKLTKADASKFATGEYELRVEGTSWKGGNTFELVVE